MKNVRHYIVAHNGSSKIMMLESDSPFTEQEGKDNILKDYPEADVVCISNEKAQVFLGLNEGAKV